MPLIGNIEPFNPQQADITAYMERIEQLFICNGIEDTKKVALFLTLIGGEAYGVLKDLLSPALPSEKTYSDLKTVLINHYSPKRLVIAERYKFYNTSQDSNEDIKAYQAKLKNISKHCEFGRFLEEALRDRFVCELSSERIKQRLLTEDGLTFERACEIAMGMELAEYQTKVMMPEGNVARVNRLEHKSRSHGKLSEAV